MSRRDCGEQFDRDIFGCRSRLTRSHTADFQKLRHIGVSQNEGYLYGGPQNKGYSILGSILGPPYFGKLPNSYYHHSSGVGYLFRVYGNVDP